jgi:predicted PhzF superfamily epimerase YddE/YHI9
MGSSVSRFQMTRFHIVDAFTAEPFAGNPAAVCLLPGPVDELWMKRVAREMNLSETAFLHPVDGGFSLRWLTPAVEVKLCGHATLASAFALWEMGVLAPHETARFHTLSGWLTCHREGDWIAMDFPAKVCAPCDPPDGLAESIRADLSFCGNNGMDYLVEVGSAAILRGLRPDLSRLASLPVRGVIVTSGSDRPEFDFLSRFFAPAAGVNEDPVTGSAHCALGPYWSGKTGRTGFTAFQASERGGIVQVQVKGDRVILKGQAVLMSRVEVLH